MTAPLISIVMANYRGAAYLDRAIASVLAQNHTRLELLLIDDASGDGSAAIARDWAAHDARLRFHEMPRNGGAAAARNQALDMARGEWVAIVDSDDLIHPQRLSRLLAAATRLDAQMVADDMVFFSQTPNAAGRTLLQPLQLTCPREVTARDMLASDDPAKPLPPLGYLKPLIARKTIGNLRYDTSLSISEDMDFYLRLLIGGARLMALPDPMYLYRRHSASLSYRLSCKALEAMLDAQARLSPSCPPSLSEALETRRRALEHMLRYQRLVDDLKAHRWGPATIRLARAPGLFGNLVESLQARRKRMKATQNKRKYPLSLSLGATGSGATHSVPPPPEAGACWDMQPADPAAEISALMVRHALSLETEDEAGAWFAWIASGNETA